MVGTDVDTGISALIDRIRHAVKKDRVTELAGTLADLHATKAFDNPHLFAIPRADRYARRLIWKDPDDRFVIIGMTWLPGQSSPLHDHAGLWGAEIVVRGTMRETTFRLVDQGVENRYQFIKERTKTVTQGNIGILIPPLEYHDFGNIGTAPAYTLHVYSGDIKRCLSFTEGSDGLWQADYTHLEYDG